MELTMYQLDKTYCNKQRVRRKQHRNMRITMMVRMLCSSNAAKDKPTPRTNVETVNIAIWHIVGLVFEGLGVAKRTRLILKRMHWLYGIHVRIGMPRRNGQRDTLQNRNASKQLLELSSFNLPLSISLRSGSWITPWTALITLHSLSLVALQHLRITVYKLIKIGLWVPPKKELSLSGHVLLEHDPAQ